MRTVYKCMPNCGIYQKIIPKMYGQLFSNPNKVVIVQTAPAIRAAIGEGWDMPHGKSFTGKTVAALRRLGFDLVFDTNFTADLTIVERSHEFIERLANNHNLPMLTSCSPRVGLILLNIFIQNFCRMFLLVNPQCRCFQRL